MINNIKIFLPIFVRNKLFVKKKNKINIILKYKKKNLNLFNNFKIENINFNSNNNFLIIRKNNFDFAINKNNKNINGFLYTWKYFLFSKIKFKGKGYKILYNKNKKNMKFFFNKSHISILIFKKLVIKKNLKNKFILISKKKFEQLIILIVKVRLINIFTLRGLRNSKQIILKRKGKKSSYI